MVRAYVCSKLWLIIIVRPDSSRVGTTFLCFVLLLRFLLLLLWRLRSSDGFLLLVEFFLFDFVKKETNRPNLGRFRLEEEFPEREVVNERRDDMMICSRETSQSTRAL